MTLPTKPAACANLITQILQTVMQAAGTSLYPVRVQEIAPDLSRQFFPEAPLTNITGAALDRGLEGMLMPIPNTANKWGIIYNNAIASTGRINFTLAHEFGHYLLHRQALEAGARIVCGRQDMVSWLSAEGQREAEANLFAAYLLMPRNLFEDEIRGEEISLHLMQHVAHYFDVSLTAVLLRWLEFTDKRAMLLMGDNGFVKWARSSEPLFKSGVYLEPKKELIELPAHALAVRRTSADPLAGIMHKAGSWPPFAEDIREMTLHANAYEATITLLLFPDAPPNRWAEKQERRTLENAVERF